MALSPDTVFFSYSHNNTEFALDLATKLRNAGADIWIDKLDLDPGDRWDNAIEEALETSKTFLVILSKDSMASENVLDEVSYAIEEDKQLVPVLMEPCKIKFRLRRFQYADFSQDPTEGMQKVIEFLNLNDDVATRLRNDDAVAIPKSPSNKIPSQKEEELKEVTDENVVENLLISPVEIQSAKKIFMNGIIQYSIFIGVLLMVSGGLIYYNFTSEAMQEAGQSVALIGSILPIIIGGLPFNEIAKKKKRLDLIKLFEIKRLRLQSVISKLKESEIEKLNEEFTNLIAI